MVVDADEAKKYTKVECMEPCVKNYCNLYTADLSERLGLDKTVLASYSLTNPILLNPMFVLGHLCSSAVSMFLAHG